jgi:hypothetical protein
MLSEITLTLYSRAPYSLKSEQQSSQKRTQARRVNCAIVVPLNCVFLNCNTWLSCFIGKSMLRGLKEDHHSERLIGQPPTLVFF